MKPTGEEFANSFSSFLNTFSTTEQDKAIEKMLRDHRSLLQATMRFFLKFVQGMAQNGSDLRNEASVKLAQEILKLDPKFLSLPKI